MKFKLFEGLFEFNNDGDEDVFESAVEIDVIASIIGDEDSEKIELLNGLEATGLYIEEFECRDYEDGIDDDYDFIDLESWGVKSKRQLTSAYI